MREWTLPFASRQINDRDPGHEGPSCEACTAYQVDRLARAENTPFLTSPYGGKSYRSPHYSTYRFEAAYSRWACTQGAHGRVSTF